MIRVYRYGLLPPIENAQLVQDQMVAAHRYRNILTEIERGRRAAVRAAMLEYIDIQELEKTARETDQKVQEAVKQISKLRAKTRDRSEPKELKLAVKKARETHKEALKALHVRRHAMKQDTKLAAEIDRIGELAKKLRKSAREHCDAFWGTYQLVEDAMGAASKAPMYDGTEPNDPHFVRWTGEGHVSVQIQHGIASSDVFGDDRRLRIDSVDHRAWSSPVRGERRKLCRTKLHMRCDSDGRDPIWASWPMLMHRPLPEGSTIKRAIASLRYIGPRQEWSLELIVNEPEPQKHSGPDVAIDIGWRLINGELRVAYWYDSNGNLGELRLDKHMIGGLRKAEDLRSIRDKNFDKARDALTKWLSVCALKDGVPAWLIEATKHLGMWKSIARLAAVANRWKQNRFEGDNSGFEELEKWRYHDYHLWCWETSQRTKSLRHRREIYRKFAAQLASKYGTLVLEKFDLRTMAVRAKPEANAENETARSNRHLCATNELRLVLANAFGRRGGREVRIPAQDTTITCHACGHTEVFDAAANVEHTCPKCSVLSDQDLNAAINLLQRFYDQEKNPEPKVEEPVVEEARWSKAKRLGKEKAEKRVSADVGVTG